MRSLAGARDQYGAVPADVSLTEPPLMRLRESVGKATVPRKTASRTAVLAVDLA
jgi:hypothetical protein